MAHQDEDGGLRADSDPNSDEVSKAPGQGTEGVHYRAN